jgi:hypothetical protein
VTRSFRIHSAFDGNRTRCTQFGSPFLNYTVALSFISIDYQSWCGNAYLSFVTMSSSPSQSDENCPPSGSRLPHVFRPRQSNIPLISGCHSTGSFCLTLLPIGNVPTDFNKLSCPRRTPPNYSTAVTVPRPPFAVRPFWIAAGSSQGRDAPEQSASSRSLSL